MKRVKGWLLTGLLVFIPFWATAVVVYKTFGLLDGWIHYFGVNIPGAGFAVLISVLLLIGVITRNYIGKKLHQFTEWIMMKIPLISTIYSTCREVSKTLLDHDNSAFKAVVGLDFAGQKTIGFVTGECPQRIENGFKYNGRGQHVTNDPHQLVYVMQAFSPASGFILLVPKSKLEYMDVPVETAMKLVLTGGMVKGEPDKLKLKMKDGSDYKVILCDRPPTKLL